MAIKKKLIHFDSYSVFNSQKLSANSSNTSYTLGVDGAVTSGEPNILFGSICFIKDVQKIWTHAHLYDCATTDLSAYLTSDEIAGMYATGEELDGKQDKVLKFENVTASSWVSDSTYGDYPYKCNVTCTGTTADHVAEVIFGITEATGGDYAPVCETGTGLVSIWSKVNTSITIPTILITT